jgi:DNA-binding PadR family transcriptional regulator
MKYVPEIRPQEADVKGNDGRRPLTTTSFAILGLLSVRDWSAYEITGQMKRGLRHSWPRTDTRIYQEPRNLVAHGLASARITATGRRPRTVYSITDEGRRALADWLEEASQPPQIQSEAVLRATFADAGSKDALLATLAGLRREGRLIQHQLGEQAADYVATGGPFPQRLHLIALVGRFLSDYAQLLEGWASWAEQVVSSWPDVATADATTIPSDVFELVIQRAARP